MAGVRHAIRELDSKGLRSFGLTTGAIVALLFGVFFPWFLGSATPLWPWILCGVLGVWALVVPLSLRPVYKTWMHFGLIMSRITTPLILGILFFAIITPVSFVLGIVKPDSMARKFESQLSTYRVKSHETGQQDLERPF